MDPDAPRCPTCGTAIQSHWDWCHFCGYDPDHLKPVGWMPGAQPRTESAGRRKKRSDRKSEKAGRKTAKKSTKQPVAAGAVSVAAGPVPVAAGPAPIVQRDDDTVDIASMLDPFVLHDDEPRPAPRSSIPPLVIEPAPARRAAPGPNAAMPEVFHVKPAAVELGLAALLVLMGAGVGYLAVTSTIQVAEGASTTVLDNVATVVFILLCAVVAFAAFAQARALMRQSVELTAREMTVHNRFGRVRRVPRNEIHQLRMSERQLPLPKEGSGLDVPYVQLTDGSGIWLDALGARSLNAAPTDEQQAMYDRLAAALATTGTRV